MDWETGSYPVGVLLILSSVLDLSRLRIEMKKAHNLLGDIPNHAVWNILYVDDTFETSPLPAVAVGFLGELPMVSMQILLLFKLTFTKRGHACPQALCIFNALRFPESFNIASLAILRSSTQQLHYSIASLLDNIESFNHGVADVEGIYLAAQSGKNIMDKGTVPYPPQAQSGSVEMPARAGMAFQLR